MSERHNYTPAALYARVSSDRQDVDLCWQPAKMAQCETREIRGRIGVW